jgi:hypothetical protein
MAPGEQAKHGKARQGKAREGLLAASPPERNQAKQKNTRHTRLLLPSFFLPSFPFFLSFLLYTGPVFGFCCG